MGLLYKEKSAFSFFYTLVVAATLGGLGWFSTRQSKVQLRTQDGFLIIVMFWLLFSAISALPLWLDDTLNVRLVDAMFEGVSGITTTGASVLNDVSNVPKSVLYYRSQLNFIGGLGLSCWRWPCCRCWASAAPNFTSRKCPARSRRNA